MDFQQNPNQSAAPTARQFSVRNLLQLTLIVSILLMIGVLASRTERFQAFSTAWTALSLVPIVAVLVAHRWQLVSPRKLVLASMLGYVAALGLPSFGGGNEFEFGVQAAFMSFVGLQYLWDPSVHGNVVVGGGTFPAPFMMFTIETSLIIACVLGASANLAYFFGIVSYGIARKRQRAFTWSRRAAIIATSLTIPAIVVLCLDSNPDTFYPGCGLWIASFLALALGTR
jgi:hypothetical protein